MRFKTDWASLIVGSKFTVLLCSTLYLRATFQVLQAPGGLIFGRGDLTEGLCVTGLGGLYLEGLIHGGAYFRNFTVVSYIFRRLSLYCKGIILIINNINIHLVLS